ncbi:uncharacterized protein BDZ99DRAFT_471915 [Mytilinidion resinicola]|uniref:Uncharacterized protein n=1 Tax=Mytilinidion resinicola TaxID=574789 RepID=A0A6A6Z7B3_9PEZI|nr:uncharacterized protein BDZ99DRAFT_471915 [Mytilinidion resinicola]KAF2816708.1 hypothetical protein BDZ99DRAFT_471915 [Mytilinidion resinicola]
MHGVYRTHQCLVLLTDSSGNHVSSKKGYMKAWHPLRQDPVSDHPEPISGHVRQAKRVCVPEAKKGQPTHSDPYNYTSQDDWFPFNPAEHTHMVNDVNMAQDMFSDRALTSASWTTVGDDAEGRSNEVGRMEDNEVEDNGMHEDDAEKDYPPRPLSRPYSAPQDPLVPTPAAKPRRRENRSGITASSRQESQRIVNPLRKVQSSAARAKSRLSDHVGLARNPTAPSGRGPTPPLGQLGLLRRRVVGEIQDGGHTMNQNLSPSPIASSYHYHTYSESKWAKVDVLRDCFYLPTKFDPIGDDQIWHYSAPNSTKREARWTTSPLIGTDASVTTYDDLETELLSIS